MNTEESFKELNAFVIEYGGDHISQAFSIAAKAYDAAKRKADKWDALDESIGKFYPELDEDGDAPEGEKDGDLIDIGEAAARAFGYM